MPVTARRSEDLLREAGFNQIDSGVGATLADGSQLKTDAAKYGASSFGQHLRRGAYWAASRVIRFLNRVSPKLVNFGAMVLQDEVMYARPGDKLAMTIGHVRFTLVAPHRLTMAGVLWIGDGIAVDSLVQRCAISEL